MLRLRFARGTELHLAQPVLQPATAPPLPACAWGCPAVARFWQRPPRRERVGLGTSAPSHDHSTCCGVKTDQAC